MFRNCAPHRLASRTPIICDVCMGGSSPPRHRPPAWKPLSDWPQPPGATNQVPSLGRLGALLASNFQRRRQLEGYLLTSIERSLNQRGVGRCITNSAAVGPTDASFVNLWYQVGPAKLSHTTPRHPDQATWWVRCFFARSYNFPRGVLLL